MASPPARRSASPKSARPSPHGQVRAARFQQLDRNGDGVLTADEFAHVTVTTVMELRDINCDGHLSVRELAAPLPQAPR